MIEKEGMKGSKGRDDRLLPCSNVKNRTIWGNLKKSIKDDF
jgi:hypothetical protein